jgi:hypothetical protein
MVDYSPTGCVVRPTPFTVGVLGVANPRDVDLAIFWQLMERGGGSFHRGVRRSLRSQGSLRFTAHGMELILWDRRADYGSRDPLIEGRDWATIPTHLDRVCPGRLDLTTPAPASVGHVCQLPLPLLVIYLVNYAFALLGLSLFAHSGVLLALLIRAGRVWVDFRPARSPGRIVRCGRQVTRGPNPSRMTQFPVIRGMSLANA